MSTQDFLRLVVLIYHTTGLFNLEEAQRLSENP
jgi:hypothetical protein